MPILQVSMSFATKGTMPRDTSLATMAKQEQIDRLIPEAPKGGVGWAHWQEAEELVCNLLGRKKFYDQDGPIENAEDLRRLGVWYLKATLQDEKGNSNTLTLINDEDQGPNVD
jgi:hypothetical protein